VDARHKAGHLGDRFAVEELAGRHCKESGTCCVPLFKAQNVSRRHAAVAGQFTGKIEQSLVAAGPADERKPYGAAIDRPARDANLRKA
jgi:hypothetical protein